MAIEVAEIGKPPAPVAVEAKQDESDQPRTRALLIEDNPGDARLIELMLAEAGGDWLQVEVADRLEHGLERLAAGGVGIVLVDLSLPDSQGLATFRRLHARAPEVPIIVLSGLNDTQVAVGAVHEGAQDYLIKGQVDAQLLVRAMRYAIERKNMAREIGRYAEELRLKNAQLEADIKMAREIQEIFLPNQYPVFPKGAKPKESALQFSARYLPAAAVGGDFFDIFPVSPSAAGVFICDVMGHGLRAALVTAIMRGLVEELLPIAGDAGQFLTEINHSLHAILSRTREPFLATAFYMVADVAKGELCFSSAGHPSPFHIERNAGAVRPLTTGPCHGPALGLFSQSDYPNCHQQIAPNDLLLLFTDGLYEVYDAHGSEYGQERLLAAVRERKHLPADRLFDELLRDVRRFAKAKEFEDDVCLVGVEIARIWNPAPAPVD